MTARKLLVKAGSAVYGLPIDQIVSMIPIGEIRPIPGATGSLRGSIAFQHRVVPLVDLRLLMGEKTIREERSALVEMLTLRERDHVEWLDELTSAVKEQREFRKTTDPTKCAFGQWYYSFKSNDPMIARALSQFEEPHAIIHKTGDTIVGLIRDKKTEEALEAIENARRSQFSLLLRLFGELRALMTSHIREIALILADHQRCVALAVDEVLGLKDTEKAERSSGQVTLASEYLLNTIFLDNTQVNLLKVIPILAIASNAGEVSLGGGA